MAVANKKNTFLIILILTTIGGSILNDLALNLVPLLDDQTINH